MSYAVMKDGSSWRSVDGPEADPDDSLKSFPDPVTEIYCEAIPPDPVAPPPTAAEALATANDHRDSLLAVAAIRIAPLQDAVDLDSATDAEKALLTLWKRYRVAVNRVTAHPDYPNSTVWPAAPGE